MPRLMVVGLSHRTAPLAVREMFAVPAAALPRALQAMRAAAAEVVWLSTCNRSEAFCAGDNAETAAAAFANFARAESGVGGGDAPLFTLCDREAARHLFEVACGLDSMIPGEPEITGQVKRAYLAARENGAVGAVTARWFESALASAKVVRTQTRVGRKSASFPGLLAKVAAQIFGEWENISVLHLGTGDVMTAALRHFHDRGAARLAVAGRSLERAKELGQRFNAEPLALRGIGERLHEFDVVAAATESPSALVGKGAAERALARRRHRPMLFADLAVPRNIEAGVGDLPDAFLYTVDQLGEMARAAREARKEAAADAAPLIDEAVDAFMLWLRARKDAPHIARLRAAAEQWRAAAFAPLAAAEVVPTADAEQHSRRVAAHLLHAPSKILADDEIPAEIKEKILNAYLRPAPADSENESDSDSETDGDSDHDIKDD